MIPEEHLTLGGATSAAIALAGSLFNVIRFSSNSLIFKNTTSLSHVASQLTGTLRRQEASKQPYNTSRHLPLHLEPHLHFPRSPSQCTGHAETHVGVGLFFGNSKTLCRYMEEHPFLCQSFACLFYWSFASLLFLEVSVVT